MLVPILLFALGLVLLIKGGDWFVDGATGFAHRFNMPELLIGATVVSIGTTLPEVMVSASSALKGHGEIAYGNAIGSIICNTALILALTIAVKPSVVNRKTMIKPVCFFFTAAVFYSAIAYFSGYFTRVTGILLLVIFVVYMILTVKEAISSGKEEGNAKTVGSGKGESNEVLASSVKDEVIVGADESSDNNIVSEGQIDGEYKTDASFDVINREKLPNAYDTERCVQEADEKSSKKGDLDTQSGNECEKTSPLWKELVLLVVGAALIAIGADLLVDNGTLIAKGLGVPESVIALTFVALGTSLPELVTAITSLAKGHGALSLGNVIGANLFNLVLVSGMSITLNPFTIPVEKSIAGYNASLVIDIPVMFFVMAFVTVPALIRGKLSRVQGIVLLTVYAAFCIFQFVM